MQHRYRYLHDVYESISICSYLRRAWMAIEHSFCHGWSSISQGKSRDVQAFRDEGGHIGSIQVSSSLKATWFYHYCSYQSSVCELLFSLIKRTDMNPDRIPTGKSKLSDAVRLIFDRILEIKESTLILMTHHIILMLYQYLLYKPLWGWS